MKYRTAETWLNAAYRKMTPYYARRGMPVPPIAQVQMSVGYPPCYSLGAGKCPKEHGRRVAWATARMPIRHNKRQRFGILIAPGIVKPVTILGHLMHEMAHLAHAWNYLEFDGHKRAFITLCITLEINVDDPAATYPTPWCVDEFLRPMARDLGPYPFRSWEQREDCR